MKTIGERIKQARKAARMTQTDLAEAVGIKQPSVSAWEADEAVPTTDLMREIATAMATKPGLLQFGEDSEEQARVVGRIGAGAVVVPYSDLEKEGELVPKPAGFEHLDVEAYEIQGDSMYPLK